MISPIQQLYYAWDISHKKSVSDESRFTGVLSEARVDLNPHQVEAALFAFKSPLSKGAILADEVGLGKTIEAGIILSEMWAENKRNIIIIVPASLRNQWNLELMGKFYLPSFILDKDTFEEKKEQISSGLKSIYICSYNFAFANCDFFSGVSWDLVIYDEAHKLRNVYKKGNVMANILKATFKNYKKVLLTATPLQNNLKELYGLISIIDPEYFSSLDTFANQYNAISTRDKAKYGELKERLKHIIHRTLRKQVQEYVNFTKRIALVQEYTTSFEETKLYSAVSEYLMREGTYGVPERQRPLLSLLVRKIMSSSAYALSFTLERFIQRLKDYKTTGEFSSTFACLENDLEDNYDDESSNSCDYVICQNNSNIDDEIRELEGFRQMSLSIKNESKAKKLLEALTTSFAKIKALGSKRKALIFTESRRTQDYLYSFLQQNGYNGRVICFNGTNDSDDAKKIYRLWLIRYAGTNRISGNPIIDRKQAIVDTFQNDADILIATEAGAEGINLQFCSLVINYDMPWNPQRIEQRIGRCHRYGQKNDVVVVNFVNQSNYADRRVYDLLNDKFSLFDGVFGASDEVLGTIDSGIDFERRLNNIYNTCRTEREIAAAFNELQKELDEIIKERVKNTRKSLLENFDEEVINKLRVRQFDDANRTNIYNRHLWAVATSALQDKITNIDQDKYIFSLSESLADNIPAGTYIINKDSEEYIQLRYGHPLGQYVVKKTLSREIEDEVIIFDLSTYPFKVSLLEQYKNKSGCACVYRLTASNEYDGEEQIIACAQADDGEMLPEEFVYKLLELECINYKILPLSSIEEKFEEEFSKRLKSYKDKIDDRTNNYVDYEITKYEMWADDQLVPLRNEVMTLNKEYEAIRRQIRKEHNAATKLQLKKDESQKSKLLRQKRSKLMMLEDEYNDKVDDMTERLQKSMLNHIDSSVMFRFKWEIQ